MYVNSLAHTRYSGRVSFITMVINFIITSSKRWSSSINSVSVKHYCLSFVILYNIILKWGTFLSFFSWPFSNKLGQSSISKVYWQKPVASVFRQTVLLTQETTAGKRMNARVTTGVNTDSTCVSFVKQS